MLNLYDATFIVAILFIVGVLLGNIVHGSMLAIIIVIGFIGVSVYLWRTYRRISVMALALSLCVGSIYGNMFAVDPQNRAQAMSETTRVITEYLSPIKTTFETAIKAALPARTAALALGLLLGDTSGFDKEMKEEFKRSGTTHIVALSGFNIMIIAGFIAGLLSWASPLVNLIATIMLITLFVLMTGAEASAVRAAIMGGLLVIANYSGRIYAMRNVITVTAAIMLIQNPTLIVGSVGFQLSFFALLGIVYIEPILKEWIKTENGFINAGLTTIAAQIGVLPILINTFGSFSWSSIFSNILIGVTVPYAMLAAFVTGIVGILFGGVVATFVGLFAHYILAYELFIIRIASKFGFMEGFTRWNIGILMTYYALLLFIVIMHHREQQQLLKERLHGVTER